MDRLRDLRLLEIGLAGRRRRREGRRTMEEAEVEDAAVLDRDLEGAEEEEEDTETASMRGTTIGQGAIRGVHHRQDGRVRREDQEAHATRAAAGARRQDVTALRPEVGEVVEVAGGGKAAAIPATAVEAGVAAKIEDEAGDEGDVAFWKGRIRGRHGMKAIGSGRGASKNEH